LDFAYDTYRHRWEQVYSANGSSETTFYAGGLLEEVINNGVTDYRHYIYAGGEPVAVYSRKSTLVNTLSYLQTDHQGGSPTSPIAAERWMSVRASQLSATGEVQPLGRGLKPVPI
jgi:hypothetical protein